MERTGREKKSLGPSDSSDSGSDLIGAPDTADDLDDNSDRAGTGEGLPPGRRSEATPGVDVSPSRVVDAAEAGLGGGLDEAEEAEVNPVRPARRSRARRAKAAKPGPAGEK
jgi:hypothetical protein